MELSDTEIDKVARELFCVGLEEKEGAWGPNTLNQQWCEAIARPFARAILAAKAAKEQPEQPGTFHLTEPSGEAATAQLSALRAFAQDVLDGWPDGAGVDGFELQDLCEKHGLLKLKDPAPTQPCAEDGGCACAGYYGADEFASGVQCYEKTAVLTGADNASPRSDHPLRIAGESADRFCDSHCTWRDHHPECERSGGVPPASDLLEAAREAEAVLCAMSPPTRARDIPEIVAVLSKLRSAIGGVPGTPAPDLRSAAQAVLDRWNSPQWEWAKQGPTADLMADLARALDGMKESSNG